MISAVRPTEPADPAAWLTDASARRPGELLEPVSLMATTAVALHRASQAAGTSNDIAATVLIERCLAVGDLETLDLTPPTARPADLAPTRCLTAAEGDYLRRLTLGNARHEHAPALPAAVTVPVRLISWAPDLLDGATRAPSLAAELSEALAWEVAALVAGRTMGEWVLVAAVRARASCRNRSGCSRSVGVVG